MNERVNLEDNVLSILDHCSTINRFPALDNSYAKIASCRMEVYSDGFRWAILIETLRASTISGGWEGLKNSIYCIGNCLKNENTRCSATFIDLVDDLSESDFSDEDAFKINGEIQSVNVRIRGNLININLKEVLDSDILTEYPDIMTWDIMRFLAERHSALLFASDQELLEIVPEEMPLILKLNEWHHPDVSIGEIPSENDTFQEIAKCIQVADGSGYASRTEPNTHWSYWM